MKIGCFDLQFRRRELILRLMGRDGLKISADAFSRQANSGSPTNVRRATLTYSYGYCTLIPCETHFPDVKMKAVSSEFVYPVRRDTLYYVLRDTFYYPKRLRASSMPPKKPKMSARTPNIYENIENLKIVCFDLQFRRRELIIRQTRATGHVVSPRKTHGLINAA